MHLDGVISEPADAASAATQGEAAKAAAPSARLFADDQPRRLDDGLKEAKAREVEERDVPAKQASAPASAPASSPAKDGASANKSGERDDLGGSFGAADDDARADPFAGAAILGKGKREEASLQGMAQATSPLAAAPAEIESGAAGALGSQAEAAAPPPPASPPVQAKSLKVAADESGERKPSVISREELVRRRADLRANSIDKADRGQSSRGAAPAADAARARRLEQANIALASAEREAKAKRWLSALDQYANAEALDHDRALGATPLVGQLRVLIEIKRPVDAAKVARRFSRWDIKSFDVPAGLLLGAQVAEQIGDERLARELWTRLLDVPAQRAKAQAALARLSRAQVVRQSPASAVDSEAAAKQAPAAASTQE